MIRIKQVIARALIKPVLRVHDLIYVLATRFSIHASDDGVHPKHDLIQYEKWFEENVDPSGVVLDVGCNTGILSYQLSQKVKYVIGIDIDKRLVDEALTKRRRDNIEYICADATSYDFRTKNIDCVILSNVLEHIYDRIGFLKRLIANLNWAHGKGVFLIRVPMIDRDWITVYKKKMGVNYMLDETHYVEYTIEDFIAEIGKAGLTIDKHYIRFGELYAVCRLDGC